MSASVTSSSRTTRRLLSPVEMAVLGLFFLSGASALVYEVVWSRSLTNVFGGSAFAVATVLAAFMAGLALGSTLLGRAIDRRGNPLVVYGILEIGIGVWALVLPRILAVLNHLYAAVYQDLDPGFYTLNLVRFVLCFLVLLVPTTMMGGTLPVLGKLLLRDRRLGERAGFLYGANTLGAVLGTASGGFLLLPAFGLWGSTLLAVALNVVVGLAAIGLSRVLRIGSDSADALRPETGPETPAAASRLLRVIPWVYAASGFAALAYEVAWTKTLSMLLGNTTYAFTAMLTTFLLGLSLGSLLIGRLADRYRRPEALLALVQTAIPLLALATIPIMPTLPGLFVDAFPRIQGSWFTLEAYRIFLAGLTLFFPTLLMGATFPLVTRIYVRHRHAGAQLGRLYAANTMGAILGSFLTGFVLIPWLGRQHSILAASFVNLAAAALLIGVIHWRDVPSRIRMAMGVVLLLMIPGWWLGIRPWSPRMMASGAYVYAPIITDGFGSSIEQFMKGHQLLFYDESTEATVSVWLTDYILSLRTNGKIEASSHGDMITQKMISHLPVLYHRGDPERALMIGLASGISVGALLTHPLESVETVELMPSMAEAARYFDRYNRDCLDDPRHHLILNDGRNHLLLTDRKYDVIVSEPSNPWIAGVGSLFTKEFFDLTKSRLNPGGIVCQWVQTYQFNAEDLRTVLGTFLDAYPYLNLWQGGPGDLIVVASLEPLELDVATLERAIAGGPGKDFADLEVLPAAQILSLFVSDRDGIERFVGDWPGRVTDDNLYLEYAVPRHMFDIRNPVDVTIMEPYLASIRTVSDVGDTLAEDVGRYRRARSISIGAKLRNRLPEGTANQEEAARLALEIAPEEVLSRALYSNLVNERAIQALVAGDIEAARPGFLEVLKTGTAEERAIALNNLGAIRFDLGDLDSARVLWDEAFALEPYYPVVISNLAAVASREGRIADAVTYLEQAAYLDPDSPGTLNNLAYHQAILGTDLEEAERTSRRAVHLDPSPNNRDTLGYILLSQSRWDDAVAVLQPIVDADPGALESLLHLGMARIGQGQVEAGRRHLQTVVDQERDPVLAERARTELGKL